jgi:autotransporter-associated beta strand protein
VLSGGAGGAGGAAPDSGSGGSGGVGVQFTAAASFTNSATGSITGGAGGAGGGDGSSAVGGKGGAGGAGVVGAGLTITNAGSITAGNGGVGGTSDLIVGLGGNGATGGAGISGSSLTVINSGSITGGNGGAPGPGGFTTGTAGAGGAGIAGSSINIINSGTITGGLGGDGVTRANAITFTGGTNTLTLQSGSTINGNIAVTGSLNFSQPTNATLSNVITGSGSVSKSGAGALTLTGSNSYAGGTTVTGGLINFSAASNFGTGAITLNGGGLQWATGTTTDISGQGISLGAAGGTFDTNGNSVTLASAITGPGGLTKTGGLASGQLILTGSNSYSGGTTILSEGLLQLGTVGTRGKIVGAVNNDSFLVIVNADTSGMTSIVNTAFGAGTRFQNDSSAGALAISNVNGSVTAFQDTSTAGAATIVSSSDAGAAQDSATVFLDNSSAGTATIVAGNRGQTIFVDTASGGQARFVTNAGGAFIIAPLTSGGTTAGSIEGAGTYVLGSKQLTVGSNNLSTTVSGVIADSLLGYSGTGGSLVKVGTGALTLSGNNLYTGGTTVSGGLINFTSANNFGTGAVTLNGGGLQWATGSTTDISSRLAPLGVGGGILDTNGNNVTFASGLSGTGGLTKQGSGMLSLNGTNTYTGGTTITGGALMVNGSLASGVTNNGGNLAVSGTVAGNVLQNAGSTSLTGSVLGGFTLNGGTASLNGTVSGTVAANGGTIGGNGTIGGLVSNGSTLAPGNSIGTLTVNGNFAQMGGVYQVEANAQGQSDRINVGGTATISSGATVQVLAQPGNYGRSTTYTILRATGGVSGAYSGVSSNFAFLTPSLSYDPNDVFLTLTLNSFDFGARTYNQRQVGRTLDQTIGSASGDYATVLNAIVGLSTTNGPITLDSISGQQYAGFSNAMVQGAQLFMSNFANRAGSGSTTGARVALAEACTVACDTTTPAQWGAWGGAVGGTGTIAGNDNAGTFTYSVGGFAGGLDRRITDNFLAGVTVGYQTGGQWTGGFSGRSVTDTFQAGLYASFLQGPLYVDALAGYAYNANQMWRNITIPGLQPRTAYGQTAANQFLGQIEAGYRVDLGGAPGYFVTPFALLQGSTANQNGFTETGAQSLNLNITQQTSGSLRSIIGAQLWALMDVGLRDRIAAQLRFGWSHEYADTARPVTATFAGAPSVPFTVFGAAPTRDGAVLGFSVSTAIAEAMGVYLRYEGNIAGQDSSHALTAGLRKTW